MTISRTIELVDVTPAELAELFCEMDGQQQADFFAAVHSIARTWQGAGWCQQSYAIDQGLTREGRYVIRTLANHVLAYEELHYVATLASELAEPLGENNAVVQLARAAIAKAKGQQP